MILYQLVVKTIVVWKKTFFKVINFVYDFSLVITSLMLSINSAKKHDSFQFNNENWDFDIMIFKLGRYVVVRHDGDLNCFERKKNANHSFFFIDNDPNTPLQKIFK